MPRMRLLIWTSIVAAIAGSVACSDTKDGGDGSGATGSGNTGCSGAFCLDQDQKPAVLPAKLVFTDIAPGQEELQELRISNVGSRGALQVKALTFDPPTAEFTVTDFVPATLEPQKQMLVHVRYVPTESGAKTLKLIVDNNAVDATRQKLVVPVSVASGGNALLIQPSPVDFGNVDGKVGADQHVSLINIGTKPLMIGTIKLSQTGSADFSVPVLPDLSVAIGSGASMDVTIHYAPTGGDQDLSTLLVETLDGRKDSVSVLGAEIAPDIVSIPPKRDLGNVLKGTSAETQVKILNQGMAKLTVSAIDVFISPAQAAMVAVKVDNLGPFDLASQQGQMLTITLSAKDNLPNNGVAVASLQIHSNDPGTPTLIVPLFAHSEIGQLQVTPETTVDFGFAGPKVKVKRTVSVFNKGAAGLDISAVTITGDTLGEFSLVPGNFKPTSSTPSVETLAGNTSDAFQVQFEAKGPAGQAAKAKLHIVSTDSQYQPDYPLDLQAIRADGTECKIALTPPVVNFGLLPYGMSKTLAVGIQNIGSGYCAFMEAKLIDCYAEPFSGIQGPSVCKPLTSPYYHSFAPSTKLFNMAPGDSGQLLVELAAPDGLGMFGGGKANVLTNVDGLLIVSFKDVSSGASAYYPNIVPTSPGKAAPNLVAKVGKADVQVLPGEIDFGIVSVGCKSPVKQASVYNIGTTDIAITKVETQGCGPEVNAVGWPGIPKTGLKVIGKTPAIFGVQYAPQNQGQDACNLVIYTDMGGVCADKNGKETGVGCTGPSAATDCTGGGWCKGTQFTVPMIGEGTLDTEFTDLFEQGTGKKVDVLFVVDDSGSMDNKQSQLSKNFQEFVKIAVLWANDYHIGVVTTDMDETNKSGRLQQTGGVRIVTKADADPTQKLLTLAKPGTNGSGSEAGMEAAAAALTIPLITNSTKACKVDADCPGGSFCVKGADDGLLFCGGWNRTFLRKNASLEVVVLSDEEDGSPSDVDYYANLFYSIHGVGNKNLFHFHAIAGDPNGGCKSNGGAEAGNRYYDLTQKTGGKFGSICAADYAQFLKDIGNAAFGLTEQYFLTRTPEPATITVKVNGAPCPASPNGWTYDAGSNSVTFVPKAKGGACMPQTNDKIAIHYKMLCFP